VLHPTDTKLLGEAEIEGLHTSGSMSQSVSHVKDLNRPSIGWTKSMLGDSVVPARVRASPAAIYLRVLPRVLRASSIKLASSFEPAKWIWEVHGLV
jgi:hypothetical protein